MTDFAFHRPTTLEEAARLLAGGEGVRCLAGGQTLVAMLNAKLVDVQGLVALDRIVGLDAIEDGGDYIEIGAMATHRAIAISALLTGAPGVIKDAARVVANPAVRNFGTIGGNIAHADPSADYPAAVVAADATVVLMSAGGRREIPARDFFIDYFTTAAEPNELVAAIKVPKGPAKAIGHYLKFARVEGDYATVAVAVTLAAENGRCSAARIALNACGPRPISDPAADAALVGSACGAEAIAAAADLLVKDCDPIDDVRGSAAYRLAIIPKLVERAVMTAWSKTQ